MRNRELRRMERWEVEGTRDSDEAMTRRRTTNADRLKANEGGIGTENLHARSNTSLNRVDHLKHRVEDAA